MAAQSAQTWTSAVASSAKDLWIRNFMKWVSITKQVHTSLSIGREDVKQAVTGLWCQEYLTYLDSVAAKARPLTSTEGMSMSQQKYILDSCTSNFMVTVWEDSDLFKHDYKPVQKVRSIWCGGTPVAQSLDLNPNEWRLLYSNSILTPMVLEWVDKVST